MVKTKKRKTKLQKGAGAGTGATPDKNNMKYNKDKMIEVLREQCSKSIAESDSRAEKIFIQTEEITELKREFEILQRKYKILHSENKKLKQNMNSDTCQIC